MYHIKGYHQIENLSMYKIGKNTTQRPGSD